MDYEYLQIMLKFVMFLLETCILVLKFKVINYKQVYKHNIMHNFIYFAFNLSKFSQQKYKKAYVSLCLPLEKKQTLLLRDY